MSVPSTYARSIRPPMHREVPPEELYANPQWGSFELVQGRLEPVSPPGHAHGELAGHLFALLWRHVRARKLGKVYPQDTGFLFPDGKTVRGPDVMFVSQARLGAGLPREGYLPVVPDFAVEIISEHDTFSEVAGKAASYLAAGVRLVWVIDPVHKTVHVFHPDRSARLLGPGTRIDGEKVIPGFRLGIDKLFAM